MKIIFAYLVFFMLCGCSQNNSSLTKYVNPFIGTGGHGHTFPGAVLPFGMVQLSPDTRIDGSWDGCSGYHYSDSVIYGFSHTHLSGTGVSDWGDVLITPVVNRISTDPATYSSKFSHVNEKAQPGYYEVLLHNESIKCRLTVSQRTGIHQYTFPRGPSASLLLDLLHRDKTIRTTIRRLKDGTITGSRVSEGWAKEQHVYYAMQFSKPIITHKYSFNRQWLHGHSDTANGASFTFDNSDGEPLLVKVAISTTSEEGALKNLSTEATHWNFELYRQRADSAWAGQLSKIRVSGNDEDKKTIFYSALYHASVHPSLNMDVDGTFRGRDNNLHKAQGFTNYSVFSLWDTYRGAHPLFTIIEPERTADFINSFLAQYDHSGTLPVWELSSNETNCMIGFHAVSVIADAMVKGIKGFDYRKAFEASVTAADQKFRGIDIFNANGFLQAEDESESVSKTLEYSYDNWCVAQMALALKDSAAYVKHMSRSNGWKNLLDPETHLMRPRTNGYWLHPFVPAEVNNHFTEANSWQYSFYVPHDVNGLMNAHGGKKKFAGKLDGLFTAGDKPAGRDQADISGLIGQYAHGNEPSHHMAYLYNDAGRSDKTKKLVRRICNEFYRNSPDGLIGNEDCGQMSAWYVMTAMGFYPVCPGSPYYYAGEQQFNNVVISTRNFTTEIREHGHSNDNRPEVLFIDHNDVVDGGKIKKLNQSRSSKQADRNHLPWRDGSFSQTASAPVIAAASRSFTDSLRIEIKPTAFSGDTLYYALSANEYAQYSQPFYIKQSSVIKAKSGTATSGYVSTAQFYRRQNDFSVSILTKLHPQYTAEGSISLHDGIYGDTDWRKGDWVGVQGEDLELVVTMNTNKKIRTISLSCLQDSRSWIIFPKEVLFYASEDNRTFDLLTIVEPVPAWNDTEVQIMKFIFPLTANMRSKYYKLVAKNFGTLPAAHQGRGGQAYIFADEITAE
jgi:predicted alpha-1,2-mannosidase